MLVLSIKEGEVVYFEQPDGSLGTIQLAKRDNRGQQIRFDFPHAVKIWRESIYQERLDRAAKTTTVS